MIEVSLVVRVKAREGSLWRGFGWVIKLRWGSGVLRGCISALFVAVDIWSRVCSMRCVVVRVVVAKALFNQSVVLLTYA